MAHLRDPTSTTTCRHRIWLYSLWGFCKSAWAWLIEKILSGFVVRVTRQITLEDAGIFADVQKGLGASVFRGVIGTREEPIWAFQRFLLNACGREPALSNGQE
jgi:choline monooxygenase